MRLLFDQNLSRRLPDRLADVFPESLHVSVLGLSNATDLEVWSVAKEQGFTIITKDSDFNELQLLQGFPPYVIWVGGGTARQAISRNFSGRSVQVSLTCPALAMVYLLLVEYGPR